MPGKDIFQAIGALDDAGVKRLVDRLEYRGQDTAFVAMRDAYLRPMGLAATAQILDLGCGTGVVARALVARSEMNDAVPAGRVTGIDYSPRVNRSGPPVRSRGGSIRAGHLPGWGRPGPGGCGCQL